MDRETQAAQYIIEDMAAQVEKQKTIQNLTDLMSTIQMAYYKGCETGSLWVHENGEAGISIDLYNFGGDGKPVCDGLTFRAADADARQEPITPFCICYDPDNEQHPIILLCVFGDDMDDFELTPENVSANVLQNITRWLEKSMQPIPKEEKKEPSAKDIIALWNEWCMDYADENLWLDYMVKHPNGHCTRQHLQEKWDECYNRYGNRAAMTMFWSCLDNTNRAILTEYVTEVWHSE